MFITSSSSRISRERSSSPLPGKIMPTAIDRGDADGATEGVDDGDLSDAGVFGTRDVDGVARGGGVAYEMVDVRDGDGVRLPDDMPVKEEDDEELLELDDVALEEGDELLELDDVALEEGDKYNTVDVELDVVLEVAARSVVALEDDDDEELPVFDAVANEDAAANADADADDDADADNDADDDADTGSDAEDVAAALTRDVNETVEGDKVILHARLSAFHKRPGPHFAGAEKDVHAGPTDTSGKNPLVAPQPAGAITSVGAEASENVKTA